MLYEDFYNDVSQKLNVNKKIRDLLQLDMTIDDISSLIPCTPTEIVEVINDVASTTHRDILYERAVEFADRISKGRKAKTPGERLLKKLLEQTFTKEQLREIKNGKDNRGR